MSTRTIDIENGEHIGPEHGASAEALAERLAEWTAGGPVHGLFWLPALDAEGDLRAMDLAAFREALRVRVKNLYTSARTLYASLGAPGTFLVSATRLGGRHGYDAAGARAPLGGAVSGFTKAFKREKAEATVKVVDFGADAAPSVVADLLIEEALRDPGCVEVGYADGLRTSVGMRELPVEDGTPGMALGRESVFLVTGAAGSIVSAITTDLAAASGGTFHLLDLLPEPDRSNPDLARVATDRDGLKKDVFERLKAKGERATPALVERELTRLERLPAPPPGGRARRGGGGGGPRRAGGPCGEGRAAPSTGTRATFETKRGFARSSPRSSRGARASTSSSTGRGSRSAVSSPTRSRRSSTSSST